MKATILAGALLLLAVVASADVRSVNRKMLQTSDQVIAWSLDLNGPGAPIVARVGETVTLKWSGSTPHNVFNLSTSSCPASFSDPSVKLLSPSSGSATSGSYTFDAVRTGNYTLACGVGTHCQRGMIINIIVTNASVIPPGARARAPAPSAAYAPAGSLLVMPAGAPGPARSGSASIFSGADPNLPSGNTYVP